MFTKEQIEEVMRDNMVLMEKLTKNEEVITKDIITQFAYNNYFIAMITKGIK